MAQHGVAQHQADLGGVHAAARSGAARPGRLHLEADAELPAEHQGRFGPGDRFRCGEPVLDAERDDARQREEVAALVEESHGEGLLAEDEYDRLSGALGFTEKTVAEVMMAPDSLATVVRGSTGADVEALLATGMAIRFVKGAYREDPALLVGGPREVDEAYRALALTVLRATGDPSRLALGTHERARLNTVLVGVKLDSDASPPFAALPTRMSPGT